MRQVALTVILAQMGSFVPARSARIGVGRSHLHARRRERQRGAGQSTFMVEMRETASILRGATRRSLVILDEIGRGTSTYDGLAIAWAVAEHLHDAIGCRALFATHYHELTELARTRRGVGNYNVAARETATRWCSCTARRRRRGPELRRRRGAARRRAGDRARARAGDAGGARGGAALPSGAHASLRGRDGDSAGQLEIFAAAADSRAQSEVEATLRALDLDRMTPVEALVALARLKQLLR